MSGRVTRKNNRRRNVASLAVCDWLILGKLQPGECEHVRHDKEFGRLCAEFRLFGPWEGLRTLPECGCEFLCFPVVSL